MKHVVHFDRMTSGGGAFRRGVMRGLASALEVFDPPVIGRRGLPPSDPAAGFQKDKEALRGDVRRAEAVILGRHGAGRGDRAG